MLFKEEASIEHVFRAYDVRGVIGKELTPEVIARIGVAYGNFIKGSGEVAIAKDTRTSGNMVEGALISGLVSTGISVERLGILPIPTLNYHVMSSELVGGIMITASHNPPEYNGIRFRRADGTGYTEENVKIKELFFSDLEYKEWNEQGNVYFTDRDEVVHDYIDFVLSENEFEGEMTVVLDCGNGTSAVVAPRLFREAGFKVITLNSNMDGTFPGRESDPVKGDLGPLVSTVKSSGAEFGVAYDGDSDRAVFVDDAGNIWAPEESAILMIRYLFEKGFKKRVVANVSCSMIVEEEVKRLGGEVFFSKVGDVFVSKVASEKDATLGVESSAHFFFPCFGFKYDDAIFASILMAKIVSEYGTKLSEVYKTIPKYVYKKFNVECPDKKKFKVVEKMKEYFEERGEEVLTLDGVKVSYTDGWVLARPSNTEPIIRIVVEGKTNEFVEEKRKEVMRVLEEAEKEAA
ncbi:MAG: phosphoglucosamine mutase [Candidatus Asgardarchaeia archaeon]